MCIFLILICGFKFGVGSINIHNWFIILISHQRSFTPKVFPKLGTFVLCAVSKVRRLLFLSQFGRVSCQLSDPSWSSMDSSGRSSQCCSKGQTLLSPSLLLPGVECLCFGSQTREPLQTNGAHSEKWKLLFSCVCFPQSQGCLSWQNGAEQKRVPRSGQESRTNTCVGSMLAAGIDDLEIRPSGLGEGLILCSHQQHGLATK